MYDHIPLLGFSIEFGGIMSAYKKGVCVILALVEDTTCGQSTSRIKKIESKIYT